jgi:putative transposase
MRGKYSKLTGWVEENIDETLTFYRLPRQHHKHLKSTNMLERLNEEIRRRTQVVRIFPNGESCLRPITVQSVWTGGLQSRPRSSGNAEGRMVVRARTIS